MSKRPAHHPERPKHMPLPVRLSDMADLEERYLAATPDERMEQHLALAYYSQLTEDERFVLERRFPNELASAPDATDGPDATEGVRVTWDLRSRELIVCMLQYAERVLEARMDLVRVVEPLADVALLAMTATGSFLELDRPASDGSRAYVYRASARPQAQRVAGYIKLSKPVRLGNPVELESIRTSELLIVAAGPDLPPDDHSLPGRQLLFGPVEDEPVPQSSDPMKVGATRFRVLVDAAENAADELRQSFQESAMVLAADLQRAAAAHRADGGGYPLTALAWFTTGSGARYDVMQHGDMDLVRHGSEGEPIQWLHDASIPEQMVAEGAPLVIFHTGLRSAKKVAFVFRVAQVGPLVYANPHHEAGE